MHMGKSEPIVAVLLSTYNGARFLRSQLESLLAQTHQSWILYWRDDGSQDDTVAILEDFASVAGQGRCVRVVGPNVRLGPTGSFLTLLRSVADGLSDGDTVAFADQDDVWLPCKLQRGVRALSGLPPRHPALYCARQILVDAELRRIGLSEPAGRAAGFPASLTQNIATGCTVMLNRAAASMVAGSVPAPASLHDWWCYLVVTAAGGRVVRDNKPVVLYRQHAGNLVGAPGSKLRRAIRAVRRGPCVFIGVMRQHIEALTAQPHLLSDTASRDLAAINAALGAGPLRRLSLLRMSGLHRQTWSETMLFRCWFLFG